jgi:hypothetical protein
MWETYEKYVKIMSHVMELGVEVLDYYPLKFGSLVCSLPPPADISRQELRRLLEYTNGYTLIGLGKFLSNTGSDSYTLERVKIALHGALTTIENPNNVDSACLTDSDKVLLGGLVTNALLPFHATTHEQKSIFDKKDHMERSRMDIDNLISPFLERIITSHFRELPVETIVGNFCRELDSYTLSQLQEPADGMTVDWQHLLFTSSPLGQMIDDFRQVLIDGIIPTDEDQCGLYDEWLACLKERVRENICDDYRPTSQRTRSHREEEHPTTRFAMQVFELCWSAFRSGRKQTASSDFFLRKNSRPTPLQNVSGWFSEYKKSLVSSFRSNVRRRIREIERAHKPKEKGRKKNVIAADPLPKEILHDLLASEMTKFVHNFPRQFQALVNVSVKKRGYYVCDSLFGRTYSANWRIDCRTFHRSVMKGFYRSINEDIKSKLDNLPPDAGLHDSIKETLRRQIGECQDMLTARRVATRVQCGKAALSCLMTTLVAARNNGVDVNLGSRMDTHFPRSVLQCSPTYQSFAGLATFWESPPQLNFQPPVELRDRFMPATPVHGQEKHSIFRALGLQLFKKEIGPVVLRDLIFQHLYENLDEAQEQQFLSLLHGPYDSLHAFYEALLGDEDEGGVSILYALTTILVDTGFILWYPGQPTPLMKIGTSQSSRWYMMWCMGPHSFQSMELRRHSTTYGVILGPHALVDWSSHHPDTPMRQMTLYIPWAFQARILEWGLPLEDILAKLDRKMTEHSGRLTKQTQEQEALLYRDSQRPKQRVSQREEIRLWDLKQLTHLSGSYFVKHDNDQDYSQEMKKQMSYDRFVKSWSLDKGEQSIPRGDDRMTESVVPR